ncbi:acyltransferase [Cellulomonas sp.]|uniref:acyltransferase family protein n=1 Tax=Cellulomonas sp. TaxID=40001 RepID=UPI001B11E41A|nr:acyltransferase [Cellulomonas sp.]MBO9555036.1 acyltransferase [Cellulomonas sp.]
MPDGRGDEHTLDGGSSRAVGLRTRVVDAAAATPAHRDRYVDLLRAVAIVVVVLGHWLVAAVTVDAGRLGWVNALAVLTWAHPLTWLVQVMPVVFLVGGFANAASWESRGSWGESAAGWVRGRALRLLRPTAAFLAYVVASYAVAVALGADPVVARTAVWAAAMSLWFLVVYLVVVSVAPALLAADRRWGLWGVLVLVAVVALGDVARVVTGRPGAAAASYVAAWVAIHQVGVAWRRGALTRVRRHAWALAGGGLAMLVALTGWGPYAVTMVGAAPPPALSNTAPPTLALLALAAAQTGVVLLLRPAADRWLRRPRVWLAVVAVNAVVLTVFLWHMVPVVIVGTTLVAHGLLPQHDVGSGLWWAWRVPWLVLLAALLVPIVAVAGRWERPRSARPAEQAALTTAAGVVLSLAGLAGLGVGGPDGVLPDVGGIPVGELLLFAAGVALLVGRPRRPTD